MPVQSRCIIVDKKNASRAIEMLRKCGCIRSELRIKHVNNSIKIPIKDVNEDLISRILSDINYTLCYDFFDERTPSKTYKDILKGRIPNQVIKELPRSYDIIGDIAIIKLKSLDLIEGLKDELAKAIMKISKNVKSVYAEIPGLETEYRLRKLIHLGGEKRTLTIHREYGISMYVDVSKTYFNPSLAEEHRRIALEVREGEIVGDLFTGVGPFALHIATLKNSTIYAIDVNPYAIECLIKSIIMNENKLKGKIVPINADVRLILSILKDEVFDRVILNLPHKSLDFLPIAIEKLKRKGVAHIYLISEREELAKDMVDNVCKILRCKVTYIRRVIDYAPHKFIYRVDVVKF